MSLEDDRSLTELEFVEVAVRRSVRHVGRKLATGLLILADELMRADHSLNGGSDTRLVELNRLRRQQA